MRSSFENITTAEAVKMTSESASELSNRAQAEIERSKIILGNYWNEPSEIFARLVEQYVSTRLAGESRVSAEKDYTGKLGYWSAEDFAELTPRFENAINRRLSLIEKSFDIDLTKLEIRSVEALEAKTLEYQEQALPEVEKSFAETPGAENISVETERRALFRAEIEKSLAALGIRVTVEIGDNKEFPSVEIYLGDYLYEIFDKNEDNSNYLVTKYEFEPGSFDTPPEWVEKFSQKFTSLQSLAGRIERNEIFDEQKFQNELIKVFQNQLSETVADFFDNDLLSDSQTAQAAFAAEAERLAETKRPFDFRYKYLTEKQIGEAFFTIEEAKKKEYDKELLLIAEKEFAAEVPQDNVEFATLKESNSAGSPDKDVSDLPAIKYGSRLLTDSLLNQMRERQEVELSRDTHVYAKLFQPSQAWTMFVTEAEPLLRPDGTAEDVILYGYVHTDGINDEWGYSSLKEIESVTVRGVKHERDKYFSSGRFADVYKQFANERGLDVPDSFIDPVIEENASVEKTAAELYADARYEATGVGQGSVQRLENRGYRIAFGEPDKEISETLTGILNGATAEKFVAKGLTIEPLYFDNVQTQDFISREDVRNHPDKIYLFGDNLQKRGLGGQAFEMRGEPNTIGIPTKRNPTNFENAFFTDEDFIAQGIAIAEAFGKLAKYPPQTVIVIPSAGLGTGLAHLAEKSPKTFAYLQTKIDALRINPNVEKNIGEENGLPPINYNNWFEATSQDRNYFDDESNFPPEKVQEDYLNETFGLAASVIDLSELTKSAVFTTKKAESEYGKNLLKLEQDTANLAFHVQKSGEYFGIAAEGYVKAQLEERGISINQEYDVLTGSRRAEYLAQNLIETAREANFDNAWDDGIEAVSEQPREIENNAADGLPAPKLPFDEIYRNFENTARSLNFEFRQQGHVELSARVTVIGEGENSHCWINIIHDNYVSRRDEREVVYRIGQQHQIFPYSLSNGFADADDIAYITNNAITAAADFLQNKEERRAENLKQLQAIRAAFENPATNTASDQTDFQPVHLSDELKEFEHFGNADEIHINAADKDAYAKQVFDLAEDFYNGTKGDYSDRELRKYTDQNSIRTEGEFYLHFERALEEVRIFAQTVSNEKSIENALLSDESLTENTAPRAPVLNQYKLTDYELHDTGLKTKFKDNVTAIKLLREIEEQDRLATPEEQKALAKFSGWGGLKSAFDIYNQRPEWKKEIAELQQLFPVGDEYFAARQSTENAHYTSAKVATKIWSVAQNQLGFAGGRILEPAVGSGVFVGTMPEELRTNSKVTAVEKEFYTARIAGQLYQRSNVVNSGFENAPLKDNGFDLAISNVPFGSFSVHDPVYNALNPSIHDYFFLKSLDKVKTGGFVVALTSRFTLDKEDSTVREAIARRADLVGAVRLPETAFKANAHTEVVTDLLIFQKRPKGEILSDEQIKELPWMNIEYLDLGDGTRQKVNNYYHRNPDNILGEISSEGRMYNSHDSFTVRTDSEAEFFEKFDTAVANFKPVFTVERELLTIIPDEEKCLTFEQRQGRKNGNLIQIDNRIYQIDGDDEIELSLSPRDYDRTSALLNLRDTVKTIYTKEIANELADTERATLNVQYDNFVKKYGIINNRANLNLLSGDPEIYLVKTLESYVNDKKGTAEKAEIFFESTLQGYDKPESADDLNHALAISLNETGNVDLDRISELLKTDVQEIAEGLRAGGDAYLNPESSNWDIAEKYLSGNVREKLILAEETASLSEEKAELYKSNVAALKEVQPKDLDYMEIEPVIGAAWIPKSDVKAFVQHLTKADADAVRVEHFPNIGIWSATWAGNAESKRARMRDTSTKIWGTERADVMKIVQLALDGKPARINDTVTIDGKDVQVLNVAETEAANQKLMEVKQEFKDWIWSDPARRTRLHRDYNDRFNNLVERKYDGSRLTFPNSNPKIEFRPHQKDAVWRTMQDPSAYLGHEVGTGKTIVLGASLIEKKRIGQLRKPVLPCLKANIKQVTREIQNLYPTAKIFSGDGAFEADSRKTDIAAIANNNWDIIVLTYNQLDAIPIAKKTQSKYIRDEIQMLETSMASALEAEGKKSRIVSRLNKRSTMLETQLNRILDKPKDDVMTFEETGIDYIAIDESHNMKSLPLYTTMTGIKGIPTTRSDRATNMHMRAEYLREKFGETRLIMASGTPITNTVAELYNIMRFTQPEELEKRDLLSFDAFAKTYTEVVSKIEATVTGDYKEQSRLAKFINVPELRSLAGLTLDIVKADEAGVVRPKRADIVVSIPISEEQIIYRDTLKERAMNMKNVDPREDNHLKLMNDGRLMSIDMRLIDEGAKNYTGQTKSNYLVSNILRISEEKPGSTQLLFSNLGIHKSEQTGFSFFNDVVDKLVEGGIPRERIANFAKLSPGKRKEAIEKLNSGEILIALGSTDTLGTGVNAQKFISALHNADVPWLPASVEQRDGRGVRYGNIFADLGEDVEIYRYVTVGSFDELGWTTIDRKMNFINQIVTNDLKGARQFEEPDAEEFSAAQISAIASGNPDVMKRIELNDSIKRLESMEKRHRQVSLEVADQIPDKERWLELRNEYTAALETDYQLYRENRLKAGDKFQITLGGKLIDNLKETSAILSAEMMTATGRKELGEFYGFKVIVDRRSGIGWQNSYPVIALESPVTNKGYDIKSNDSYEVAESLAPSLAYLNRLAENNREKNKKDLTEIEALKEQSVKPFRFSDELQKDRAELKEVEARLKDWREKQAQQMELEREVEVSILQDPESEKAQHIKSRLQEIIETRPVIVPPVFVSADVTEARLRGVDVAQVIELNAHRQTEEILDDEIEPDFEETPIYKQTGLFDEKPAQPPAIPVIAQTEKPEPVLLAEEPVLHTGNISENYTPEEAKFYNGRDDQLAALQARLDDEPHWQNVRNGIEENLRNEISLEKNSDLSQISWTQELAGKYQFPLDAFENLQQYADQEFADKKYEVQQEYDFYESYDPYALQMEAEAADRAEEARVDDFYENQMNEFIEKDERLENRQNETVEFLHQADSQTFAVNLDNGNRVEVINVLQIVTDKSGKTTFGSSPNYILAETNPHNLVSVQVEDGAEDRPELIKEVRLTLNADGSLPAFEDETAADYIYKIANTQKESVIRVQKIEAEQIQDLQARLSDKDFSLAKKFVVLGEAELAEMKFERALVNRDLARERIPLEQNRIEFLRIDGKPITTFEPHQNRAAESPDELRRWSLNDVKSAREILTQAKQFIAEEREDPQRDKWQSQQNLKNLFDNHFNPKTIAENHLQALTPKGVTNQLSYSLNPIQAIENHPIVQVVKAVRGLKTAGEKLQALDKMEAEIDTRLAALDKEIEPQAIREVSRIQSSADTRITTKETEINSLREIAKAAPKSINPEFTAEELDQISSAALKTGDVDLMYEYQSATVASVTRLEAEQTGFAEKYKINVDKFAARVMRDLEGAEVTETQGANLVKLGGTRAENMLDTLHQVAEINGKTRELEEAHSVTGKTEFPPVETFDKSDALAHALGQKEIAAQRVSELKEEFQKRLDAKTFEREPKLVRYGEENFARWETEPVQVETLHSFQDAAESSISASVKQQAQEMISNAQKMSDYLNKLSVDFRAQLLDAGLNPNVQPMVSQAESKLVNFDALREKVAVYDQLESDAAPAEIKQAIAGEHKIAQEIETDAVAEQAVVAADAEIQSAAVEDGVMFL